MDVLDILAGGVIELRQIKRDEAAAVIRVTRDFPTYQPRKPYVQTDVEVNGSWDCISQRVDVSMAMGPIGRSLLFPIDGVYLMDDQGVFTWWGAEAMTYPRWPRHILKGYGEQHAT